MKKLINYFIFLIFFIFYGCGGVHPVPYPECQNDRDCGPNRYCEQIKCMDYPFFYSPPLPRDSKTEKCSCEYTYGKFYSGLIRENPICESGLDHVYLCYGCCEDWPLNGLCQYPPLGAYCE